MVTCHKGQPALTMDRAVEGRKVRRSPSGRGATFKGTRKMKGNEEVKRQISEYMFCFDFLQFGMNRDYEYRVLEMFKDDVKKFYKDMIPDRTYLSVCK